MATQISETKIIGKIGNTVGRRGYDGKYIASAYQPDVNYPHTDAQTANNNAFATATRLVPYLDSLLCEANMANGHTSGRRGKKVAMLKQHLSNLPEGQYLPANLPIIDNPGPDLHFKELSLTKSETAFTLHAAIDPRLAKRLFRCTAVILLYNPQEDTYLSAQAPQTSLSDLIREIPPSWQPDNLHAIAYILLAFKKKGIEQLPVSIDPSTTRVSDLACIEWSQVRTVTYMPQ